MAESITRVEAATRITEWLNGLRSDTSQPIALWSDSDLDMQFLTQLYEAEPKRQSWQSEMNVLPQITYRALSCAHNEACCDLIDQYHRENGEQHHALIDARAIRAAFEALLI